MSYAEIAFEVLYPFLKDEIMRVDLREMLEDAYDDTAIPTKWFMLRVKRISCG